MPKNNTNDISKICEAVLRLAAVHPWEKITLEQIAKAAKVPLAQLKSKITEPNSVLPLIVDTISTKSFVACGKPDLSATPRDRLFEILMARFDCLQTHRKAILSIAKAGRRDPRLIFVLAPAYIKAMEATLTHVKLPASPSPCKNISAILLWGLFLVVFRTWESDETLDMSRTMAALDRGLSYADRAATFLRGEAA